MSKSETSTSISTAILVRLVRPGVDARDFQLSEGATLADLLRISGLSTADQTILVGGVPLEEAVNLTDGAVVTVKPNPSIEPVEEPWSVPILAFDDEATWAEYMEIMQERRRRGDPEAKVDARTGIRAS